MASYLILPTKLTNVLDGLDDSDLVVDGHDGDETGFTRSNGSFQLIQLDSALVIDRKVSDFEALGLELTTRVEDALVLCLRSDDVLLLGLVKPAIDFMAISKSKYELHTTHTPGHTLDGHVIALSGPGGEDNLFGICVDELGHLTTSMLNCFFALPTVGMGSAMRVAVVRGQVGKHGVQDPGVHGCGGLEEVKFNLNNNSELLYLLVRQDTTASLRTIQSFLDEPS